MKAVHVTPTRNVESILANGIHRSPPVLLQYNDTMKEDYGDAYDPSKGLVFSFPFDDHEEKWFRHFAYWKVWGNPRNVAILDWDWDRLLDAGPDAFKGIIPANEHLTAMLISIPDAEMYGYYEHYQAHDMQTHWGNMEEKYEHNDKPLVLINHDVTPDCIKYLIGTAETNVSKAGKIDILMKMKRKRI